MKNDKKVQDKIVKALKERPTKSNRGRKAEPEHEYLVKSEKQINEWEEELKNKKGKVESKEYESLYNKMTALKSRVRKKVERRQVEITRDDSHSCFDKLSTLLSQLIEPECRERIIN